MLKVFVLRSDREAQALYAFLKANWRGMVATGRALEISIVEFKAKRSVEQNRRYWLILRDIADNAWIDGKQFSAEAWAEYFKGKLIGYEETPDGRMIGISTTTLSVSEFSDYCDRIMEHAISELGIEFECAA